MDSAPTPRLDSREDISATLPVRDVANVITPSRAGAGFRDILRQTQDQSAAAAVTTVPLAFSAHAQARLQSRGIQFTPEELGRITNAVQNIASKGGREAVLLVKSAQGQQTGLLVSVKNRVVITAMDEASMREHIFTNIDSAAIV